MDGVEPDTHQNVIDTVKQAAGTETIPARFEEVEPAYRFGYGARSNYGDEFPEWNDDLEDRLRDEWEEIAPDQKQTWMQDRAAIRRGWDYEQ